MSRARVMLPILGEHRAARPCRDRTVVWVGRPRRSALPARLRWTRESPVRPRLHGAAAPRLPGAVRPADAAPDHARVLLARRDLRRAHRPEPVDAVPAPSARPDE